MSKAKSAAEAHRGSGYTSANILGFAIATLRKRAMQNYRSRPSERGLARIEVLARESDRDLIRLVARRLAEDGPEAARIRAAVSQTNGGEPPRKGAILAALRNSPFVGADLDLERDRDR